MPEFDGIPIPASRPRNFGWVALLYGHVTDSEGTGSRTRPLVATYSSVHRNVHQTYEIAADAAERSGKWLLDRHPEAEVVRLHVVAVEATGEFWRLTADDEDTVPADEEE